MTFRLLAIAIVLMGGTVAKAEDTATLDKMVQMNKKALDQLKVGQKEAARDALLEAIVVGKKAGLGTHQMMARTYLHLGAVYLTGFGDREKALRQFESAVKIKPSIQITPAVLTPTVQEVFDSARTAVGAPPEAKAEPEAKEPKEPAKESKPAVASEEPKAETRSDPKPAPSESSTRGGRKPARQAKGRPITHVAAEHPAPKPDPEPSVEAAVSAALEPEETAGAANRWWFGLGVGSGVGFHGARVLESRTDYSVPAGVSFAALAHLAPELGYRYSDKWAFSVQTQHQLIPKSGTVEMGATDNRPTMAHAVFVRAHYHLYEFQKTEIWGTGTVGGGSAIRLYVPANPDVGLPSSDTVAAGPVALGPGVSVIYRATRRVGLVAELRALATLGGFAMLADFNLGASFGF
jgi:hypothetical protein